MMRERLRDAAKGPVPSPEQCGIDPGLVQMVAGTDPGSYAGLTCIN